MTPPSPLFAEGIINCRGYLYVKIKVAPRVWVLKHRWMMEQHLGRKLKKSEIVHHKDGDTLNNPDDLSNFEIMTRKAHNNLHTGCVQWARKYEACIVCGTIDKRHSAHGLCVNCASRSKKGSGVYAKTKLRIKWARKFDRCQECGLTESPHSGHGICDRCSSYHRSHRIRSYPSRKASEA